MAELTIRPGHPDFLDLPWNRSIVEWEASHVIELPKGISRHEVRFFEYPEGIYAIKELSERAARQDYSVLRTLESVGASAVTPVGLIEHRHQDPFAEQSAALITAYEPFTFSYRELIAGPGFGPRRNQMLNAFAELLVELHLAGVFWGDCSLSNVLYRYDNDAIEPVMVDAETGFVYEGALSEGHRLEDIDIMIMNVAGGMADIAAAAGADLDSADMALGEDIAERYAALWAEVTNEQTIHPDEHYRIDERIRRLNDLGYNVEEVDLVPADEGGSHLKLKLKVGGRNFHANRLKELTGVEALENQARQVLSDLYYYQVSSGMGESATGKSIAAIQWRVQRFEPILAQLTQIPGVNDPIQAYCDLLHHRYVMSVGMGTDVGTEAALEDWIQRGRPGQPLDVEG